MNGFKGVFVYWVIAFQIVNCYKFNERSILKQDILNNLNSDTDHITEIDSPSNYRCDFENGLCNFLQNDRNNHKNWRLGKGSSIEGINGPFYDNTFGTDGGSFLYVDVNNTNDTKLNTPILRGIYCVHFFYHMHVENSQLQVVTQTFDQNLTIETFVKNRIQEDRWIETMFSFTPTKIMKYKGYKVAFIAKGKSSSSMPEYIAIDDVELYSGKCKSSSGDAYKLCTFDDDNCGYSSTGLFDWKDIKDVNRPNSIPSNDHTLGKTSGGYWYFQIPFFGSENNHFLKSPVYNKPKRSLNCLRFYFYLFRKYDDSIYLLVNLNYPSIINSNEWVVTVGLNTSVIHEWNFVEAQVDIKDKFKLQFGVIFKGKSGQVAVDDIKFKEGNCENPDVSDIDSTTASFTETSSEPTVDLRETSSEPTVDFRETSPEPTFDFRETSSKPTFDFRETSFEPTFDFRETSSMPTFDFRETSSEPTVDFRETSSKQTFDFRETSSEPTVDFRETSSKPTFDFRKTSSKPTFDIRETSFEPTFDFRETSSKPTFDFRETSFEPTVDYRETSPEPIVDFKESTPETSITYGFEETTKDFDCNCGRHSTGCYYERGIKQCFCNPGFSQRNGTCRMTCKKDEDCLNGGKCEKQNKQYSKFCNCANGYSGDRCNISESCDHLEPVCNRIHAICRLVQGKPVCDCPPEKVFKIEYGICENICNKRTCLNGRCEIVGRKHNCKCDEGYSGDACDVTDTSGNQHYMKVFTILASLVIVIFMLMIGLCCIGIICGLRRNPKG